MSLVSINRAALEYWRQTGFTTEQVKEQCRSCDRFLASRLEFSPHNSLGVVLAEQIKESQQGHAPVVIDTFKEAVGKWAGPDLRGSVLVWMEDGMWDPGRQVSRKVPTLAYGRSIYDPYTFLIPDPAFWGSYGYKFERKQNGLVDEALPWDKKQPTAFWRGASSGLEINGDDWKTVPRVILATAAKEMNDPKKIDVRISKLCVGPTAPAYQGIKDLGLMGEFVPLPEFFKYRYLFDVDGHSCAWISAFLKLSSKSLVIKVQSEYLQWYYDQLIPWVHYVPIWKSCYDLKDTLEWIEHHDKECQQIAEQASSLMQTITYDNAIKELQELLYEISLCCRD